MCVRQGGVSVWCVCGCAGRQGGRQVAGVCVGVCKRDGVGEEWRERGGGREAEREGGRERE